eukprot:4435258-Prymnesium_polylepis.1
MARLSSKTRHSPSAGYHTRRRRYSTTGVRTSFSASTPACVLGIQIKLTAHARGASGGQRSEIAGLSRRERLQY